jgi:hypothetical protein
MVHLGDRVTDSITGFSGIATGWAEYLYGCVRVQVQAEGVTPEGLPRETVWIDEQRLTLASEAKSGGPQSDPLPRSTPER